MNKHNFDFLKRLTKGMVSIFGDRCEVVIHDFTDLAHSVIHIEGCITERKIGAPITDLLFRLLNDFGDDVPDKLNYKNHTDDGKVLKCATIFVRDMDGKPEGCLCINFDITDFTFLSSAFQDLTFFKDSNVNMENGQLREKYSKNFSETMESVVDNMITKHQKVPTMMNRAEKVELVRSLEHSGLFAIKGSVAYLAKLFGASRYTIYNYLKEVREG